MLYINVIVHALVCVHPIFIAIVPSSLGGLVFVCVREREGRRERERER